MVQGKGKAHDFTIQHCDLNIQLFSLGNSIQLSKWLASLLGRFEYDELFLGPFQYYVSD
jgi:hypothetical protein